MFTSKSKRFVDKVPETPGPGKYDNKSTLLCDDKTKRFAFLNKSERFLESLQSRTDGTGLPLEEDKENECRDQNFIHQMEEQYKLLYNKLQHKIDESNRMKKEITKWKDLYQAEVQMHTKEVAMLEEKVSKSDKQYQQTVREKNSLQAVVTSKDLEIANLVKIQNALRLNLEKSEKNSHAILKEKSSKPLLASKKLEEVEKKCQLYREKYSQAQEQVEYVSNEMARFKTLNSQVSSELQNLKEDYMACFQENIECKNSLEEWKERCLEHEEMLTDIIKEYQEDLQTLSFRLKKKSVYQDKYSLLKERYHSLQKDYHEQGKNLEWMNKGLNTLIHLLFYKEVLETDELLDNTTISPDNSHFENAFLFPWMRIAMEMIEGSLELGVTMQTNEEKQYLDNLYNNHSHLILNNFNLEKNFDQLLVTCANQSRTVEDWNDELESLEAIIVDKESYLQDIVSQYNQDVAYLQFQRDEARKDLSHALLFKNKFKRLQLLVDGQQHYIKALSHLFDRLYETCLYSESSDIEIPYQLMLSSNGPSPPLTDLIIILKSMAKEGFTKVSNINVELMDFFATNDYWTKLSELDHQFTRSISRNNEQTMFLEDSLQDLREKYQQCHLENQQLSHHLKQASQQHQQIDLEMEKLKEDYIACFQDGNELRKLLEANELQLEETTQDLYYLSAEYQQDLSHLNHQLQSVKKSLSAKCEKLTYENQCLKSRIEEREKEREWLQFSVDSLVDIVKNPLDTLSESALINTSLYYSQQLTQPDSFLPEFKFITSALLDLFDGTHLYDLYIQEEYNRFENQIWSQSFFSILLEKICLENQCGFFGKRYDSLINSLEHWQEVAQEKEEYATELAEELQQDLVQLWNEKEAAMKWRPQVEVLQQEVSFLQKQVKMDEKFVEEQKESFDILCEEIAYSFREEMWEEKLFNPEDYFIFEDPGLTNAMDLELVSELVHDNFEKDAWNKGDSIFYEMQSHLWWDLKYGDLQIHSNRKVLEYMYHIQYLNDAIEQTAQLENSQHQEAKLEQFEREIQELHQQMEEKQRQMECTEGKLRMNAKKHENDRHQLQESLENARKENKLILEDMDKLRFLLEEAEEKHHQAEEAMQQQLQALLAKNSISSEEMKRVSEIHGSLLGHSNVRQKIKHISQLKDDNLSLKKENLILSKAKDQYRLKIMTLERELETYKSVGFGGTKKVKASRVERFACATPSVGGNEGNY